MPRRLGGYARADVERLLDGAMASLAVAWREHRELAEKAAASLQRAGLPAEGKRANHSLPEIRALNDLETVAERITKQLAESVDELEELRSTARALQEQRKRRTISAVLALVGLLARG